MRAQHVGYPIKGFYRWADYALRWGMIATDAQRRLQILDCTAWPLRKKRSRSAGERLSVACQAALRRGPDGGVKKNDCLHRSAFAFRLGLGHPQPRQRRRGAILSPHPGRVPLRNRSGAHR